MSTILTHYNIPGHPAESSSPFLHNFIQTLDLWYTYICLHFFDLGIDLGDLLGLKETEDSPFEAVVCWEKFSCGHGCSSSRRLKSLPEIKIPYVLEVVVLWGGCFLSVWSRFKSGFSNVGWQCSLCKFWILYSFCCKEFFHMHSFYLLGWIKDNCICFG